MLRRVTTVLLLTGLLGLGSATAALAAANPSGTGPPNQSCQAFEGPGGTNAPGNSGIVPGGPLMLPTTDGLPGRLADVPASPPAIGAPSARSARLRSMDLWRYEQYR